MPMKFVAEVVKGLFGISEHKSDETETSITVERESNEKPADETGVPEDTAQSAGEPADEREHADEPAAGVGDGDGDREALEETAEPVDEIRGIGPTYSERLAAVGIETVGALADTEAAEVANAAEVSESRAADWITQAEDR